MKVLLVLSAATCLVTLRRSRSRGLYPLLSVYLVLSITATALYHSDLAWLQHWYVLLVLPVAICRLLAGLEVAHRQTEGFRGWALLMPSVWLAAGFLTAVCWYARVKLPIGGLEQFVDLRRMSQIWLGAALLCLECWWLAHGGGWYRDKDWVAGVFSLLMLRAAVVSIMGLAGAWDGATWPVVDQVCWIVDAGLYGAMTAILLPWEVGPRFCVTILAFRFGIRRSLLRVLRYVL